MSNLYQKLPLVSIVTPSFNQAVYLEETIRSILNQDYPKIEYIVMDGGSTDYSLEIIKKYENNISHWCSKPDRGQSDAINKGFDISSGEILNWVNSDDLLEPSAVSIAVYFLLKLKDVGMIFGDRVYLDKKNNTLRTEVLPSYRPSHLNWGAYIPQETAFWRRNLFFGVGRLDINLQTAMDTDLWFRINRVAKIKHLPVILGRYREHNRTKTALIKDDESVKSSLYVTQSMEVRNRYSGRFFNPFIRTWFLKLYKLRVPFEKRLSWYKEDIKQIRIIQKYGLIDAYNQGLLPEIS